MTLRVLLVIPGMHPKDGGPPRVVSGSALALAREGVSVEIATTGLLEEEAATRAAWPELAAAGIPLHIFPRTGPWAIGISPGLEAFARQRAGDFDILHIHCIWENALARAARAFHAAGKPYCVSAHGMLDRWQVRRSKAKKWVARTVFGIGRMLRDADAILYGSREEAGEGADLRLPGQSLVMPNGIILPTAPADDSVRQSLLERFPALRDASRTVLFFSRLHPKKGLDLLVDAFGRVKADFPGAALFAVAIPQDAAHEADVKARIAALQPANIILTTELVGPLAKGVFAVADIFCLPSHQEGFSIAITEAAGAGMAMLITDKCHMPEIAESGAGLVVPDTVDGLEAGLRHMLALDPSQLRDMGRNAATLVAENYTWERVALKLIAAYRGLLPAGSPS